MKKHFVLVLPTKKALPRGRGGVERGGGGGGGGGHQFNMCFNNAQLS